MKTEIKIISSDVKTSKDGKPYTVVYCEILIGNAKFVRKFFIF